MAEYNLENLTFDMLRAKYRTGRSVRTGYDRLGKSEYKYRSGVMTELGDIEEQEWIKLVRDLIDYKSEAEMFDKLFNWEKEHNYCALSQEELTVHTLELYAMRIFEDEGWCDYLAFNNQNSPERIIPEHLVEVVFDCCRTPCLTTQKQVNNSIQGASPCPLCGRYSEFRITGNSDN